jgi:hypothetical protein
MKKTYIKPEMEVMKLEMGMPLAVSSFNPESGDNYEDEDAGSTGRRGSWGDLWD